MTSHRDLDKALKELAALMQGDPDWRDATLSPWEKPDDFMSDLTKRALDVNSSVDRTSRRRGGIRSRDT